MPVMIGFRSGAKQRRRALELGVERNFEKPYQEVDLLDAINSMLAEAFP